MGRIPVAALTGILPLMIAAGRPAVSTIVLTERHAQIVPARNGCTYVGGGTLDVQQPAPDTVVVTLLGAVVATGHPCGSSAVMEFDVEQGFDVVGDGGRLSLEAQLIGLLRGGRIAAAASNATAAVTGPRVVVAGLPDRAVGGGENVAVNDRAAPDDISVGPGSYKLNAHWRLSVSHPAGLRGKAASAEFAPAPALDPLWVGGPRDPFHGVGKKDFGLRVTLHIARDPGR
jgi:hypothetical protein